MPKSTRNKNKKKNIFKLSKKHRKARQKKKLQVGGAYIFRNLPYTALNTFNIYNIVNIIIFLFSKKFLSKDVLINIFHSLNINEVHYFGNLGNDDKLSNSGLSINLLETLKDAELINYFYPKLKLRFIPDSPSVEPPDEEFPQQQVLTNGRYFLHFKFYNGYEKPFEPHEIIYFLKNGDYKFQLYGDLAEYLDYTHIVSQYNTNITEHELNLFLETLISVMENIPQDTEV